MAGEATSLKKDYRDFDRRAIIVRDHLKLVETDSLTKTSEGNLRGSGVLRFVRGTGKEVYDPSVRVRKRFVDLAGSILLWRAAAPGRLLRAIVIKLDSRGPLFFTQERLGLHGAWFRAYKFRTMCVDAEERLKKVLENDPEIRAEYEEFHTIKEDPRGTRVGKFLRKHSLAEFIVVSFYLCGMYTIIVTFNMLYLQFLGNVQFMAVISRNLWR